MRERERDASNSVEDDQGLVQAWLPSQAWMEPWKNEKEKTISETVG